jgi:hypothetical protein
MGRILKIEQQRYRPKCYGCLALFKGSNRVDISLSFEDGSRLSFRNFAFYSYLEFRVMGKVHINPLLLNIFL